MTEDTIDLEDYLAQQKRQDGGLGGNTPAAEVPTWPPGPHVYRITDRNVLTGNVREQLGWIPANKVLTISYQSIKELEIRHAVRFFEACSVSREAALVNLGQVILLVDGYNDDPRELWEIKQVRRFFARLWRAVPHLLFFLLPEGAPGHFGSAMFLIAMLQPELPGIRPRVTADGPMQISRHWVAAEFLAPGFAAMNAFAERLGIDYRKSDEFRSLIRRINKQLGISLQVPELVTA